MSKKGFKYTDSKAPGEEFEIMSYAYCSRCSWQTFYDERCSKCRFNELTKRMKPE